MSDLRPARDGETLSGEQVAEIRAALLCGDYVGVEACVAVCYAYAALRTELAEKEKIIGALEESWGNTRAELADARAEAERWRIIRPALSVSGDIEYEGGPNYQWLRADDEELHRATVAQGWTHTVESLVDRAARAVSGQRTDKDDSNG